MEIAIISDTHIPSRAKRIPEPFEERVRSADHVIHAGDFDNQGTLSNIDAMADHLTAVTGNMDPNLGLPGVATLQVEGVEFVITHGTGSPRNYEERVASIVAEHAETADAIGISGHTHTLLDTTHEGTRLLNPGSVTGASPANETSMMTATVADGDLDIEIHRL
jgi:putative phosphoesterase